MLMAQLLHVRPRYFAGDPVISAASAFGCWCVANRAPLRVS
jgi:hypothetical protein